MHRLNVAKKAHKNLLQRGRIFIVSGPSGAGKDTIVNNLNLANYNLQKIATYTTRKPRINEKEGKPYYFVTKKQFKNLIKQDKIVEYNFYNGNYYGTSKKDIENTLKNGKNALLTIDVNGALNIKKRYPNSFLIFINSKLSDIKRRLEKRGQNTHDEIEERLKTAKKELQHVKCYDYIIQNPEGHPEKAIEELQGYIQRIIKGGEIREMEKSC